MPSLCMMSKYCIVAWLYFAGIVVADNYEFWAQMGIIINFICVPLLFASNQDYKHVSFSILGMLIGLLDITTDLNLIYQWYLIDKYYIWATIETMFIFVGQVAAAYFIGRKNESIKSELYLTQIHSNGNNDETNIVASNNGSDHDNPDSNTNEEINGSGDEDNIDVVTNTDRICTLLGFGRVFLGVKAWTSRLYQLRTTYLTLRPTLSSGGGSGTVCVDFRKSR